MFIVIGGLPGTGKTNSARLLAVRTGAAHLRVDTIEQAIVRSGLAGHPVGPAGYAVGYALSGDHLRQGLSVIAESVNPPAVTRDASPGTGSTSSSTRRGRSRRSPSHRSSADCTRTRSTDGRRR
ncbi:AAA family ATPase [Streptomyces cyaneofuscatus]|uniref:AAA family ATPase n=1 Tax=Streptomyces cyaneofuscatus TaxID=66883 RepID=UPI0039823C96